MTKVIGIDLGTSNSAIAVMEGSKPQIISNSEGSPITPSVVAYTKKGELLIGQSAKRQSVVNPENTFYSVKRFIGRKSSELTEELRAVSYKISQKGDVIKMDCPLLEKEFTAEEISAQVLRKLAADASKYLGEKVEKAVITVPAYFNDSQRRATEDAGRIAGLEVVRIVNEPTAASLSYGLNKNKGGKEVEETILVFDLGGGTLDVSILEVGEGVFEVLSTCGDSQLGGDDYDAVIVQLLSGDYYKENNIDLTKRSNAVQRLTEAAEKAKIELSSLNQTSIYLPFIALDEGASKHIDTVLTRVRFEELCSRLIERCEDPIRKAVDYAKLTFAQIDETVLVGGSTRIPAVQELVEKLVGKKPNKSLNPDEVVALGAAIQAGVLSGEVHGMLLIDRTPLSLGVETYGGLTAKVVPKGTVIPVRKSEQFSTAADNQPSVEVHVLQGERDFAKDNKSLGVFSLEIEPAKRGTAQIEIFFDIDASGILAVTAKDNITNKERSMTISGASTLSEEDVERMIREADINEAADKEKLEQVKTKNSMSEYCDEVREKLNVFESKAGFTSQSKKKIESGVVALEGAIKNEDYSAMKKLRLELEELVKREETETVDVEAVDVETLDDNSFS
jgi:molecular chaperone DnaK